MLFNRIARIFSPKSVCPEILSKIALRQFEFFFSSKVKIRIKNEANEKMEMRLCLCQNKFEQ